MSGPALLARFLLAALLAAATLLLYLGIGRYLLSGPELLPEVPQLLAAGPAALPDWTAVGTVATAGSDGLHLHNADPAGQTALFRTLAVPAGVSHLALSAEIRLQDVAGGREPWHRARVILPVRGGTAAAGKASGDWRYDLPHTVVRDRGSSGWRQVGRVFPVPAGGEALVTVQLLRATGDLWLRGLSLRPATEKAWFPAIAWLLPLLWLLGAAWILRPLLARLAARPPAPGWRKREKLLLAACLATAAAIAAGALAPPAAKQLLHEAAAAVWDAGQRAAPAAAPADPSPPDRARPDRLPERQAADRPARDRAAGSGFVAPRQLVWLAADKLGHFGGFAVLAVLALAAMDSAAPWSTGRAAVLAAALLGFAALTEIWQVTAESRGASPVDVAIDAAGLAAGALFWLGLRASRRLVLRRRGAG